MKKIVEINWKVRDFVREDQSFYNWHKNVFKIAPSPNSFEGEQQRKIRDMYHRQMRKFGTALESLVRQMK